MFIICACEIYHISNIHVHVSKHMYVQYQYLHNLLSVMYLVNTHKYNYMDVYMCYMYVCIHVAQLNYLANAQNL